MNKNLLLLAMLTFIAGLTELVVSGILPYIARDYDVSIPVAGNLITIFALCFAIAGPIIMSATASMNRKPLLMGFIVLFILGNLMSALSVNFVMLLASRIILAVCVSMLIGLGLSMCVEVVSKSFQTKAISVIMMSISSSLVLGIPLGILITEHFGWQMIFLFAAVLSVIILIFIVVYFPNLPGKTSVSFFSQWGALKDHRILFTHMQSFLFFVGQSTFYMYLTPYLSTLGMNASTISFLYLLFGVSGIIGSGLGSILVEKLGVKQSLITLLSIYIVVMLMFTVTQFNFWTLSINVILFGLVGWSMNAPTQMRLIQISNHNAGFNQTFSTSSTQFGMALGAAIGGFIIAQHLPYEILMCVGSVFIVGALCSIVYSFKVSHQ
ncbi:MFS transporter [Macrococcus capreoli]|uniref:MFS transporter n=1 Tax=Macrococcus capreoli TaxID=2982690 RepID=UPI003EE6B169